jgi:hypothetical protein
LDSLIFVNFVVSEDGYIQQKLKGILMPHGISFLSSLPSPSPLPSSPPLLHSPSFLPPSPLSFLSKHFEKLLSFILYFHTKFSCEFAIPCGRREVSKRLHEEYFPTQVM